MCSPSPTAGTGSTPWEAHLKGLGSAWRTLGEKTPLRGTHGASPQGIQNLLQRDGIPQGQTPRLSVPAHALLAEVTMLPPTPASASAAFLPTFQWVVNVWGPRNKHSPGNFWERCAGRWSLGSAEGTSGCRRTGQLGAGSVLGRVSV